VSLRSLACTSAFVSWTDHRLRVRNSADRTQSCSVRSWSRPELRTSCSGVAWVIDAVSYTWNENDHVTNRAGRLISSSRSASA